MLTESVTAIGGLKTAFDIAKTLIAAKSDSERQAAIANLQTALIDIQQHTLALQAKTAELQDEAVALRRSNEALQRKSDDFSRYVLVKFPETGTTAYRLKDEYIDAKEIEHYLCPNCYHKQEKSILQLNGRMLNCQSCKMQIATRNLSAPRTHHRLA